MSQPQTRKNLTPAVQVNPSGQLTDTGNVDLGGLDKSIVLEGDMSLEELRDSLNSAVANSVTDEEFKRFAGSLAFMEERVMIRVHPTSEKNAVQVIETFNDGVPQRFVRGHWTICKRKFVEVLARAKPFSVATPEITDGNGDRTTAIQTTNGQLYPFEMRDSNPHGQAWLMHILNEA